MLWFDGYGFPYGDYGKEVCRAYYNHNLKKQGRINGVVVGKIFEDPAIIKDFERGGAKEILSEPWQGTLTFTSWFYKKDRNSRHNARTVIEMMSDIFSKNGNLLLNVELLPDGTIPPEHQVIFDDIGKWVNLNAKAIFGSKPWRVYGDNLHSYLRQLNNKNMSEADLEALKKKADNEHFNERTVESPAYGPDEVRFTTKENKLYIFVLNPREGKIVLPSLGSKSEYNPKNIQSIFLLGKNGGVPFVQTADHLTLDIPGNRPNKYTAVFEVTGVL
jgi:alpha-L-fucosidase